MIKIMTNKTYKKMVNDIKKLEKIRHYSHEYYMETDGFDTIYGKQLRKKLAKLLED
jgi:hypothetical protein